MLTLRDVRIERAHADALAAHRDAIEASLDRLMVAKWNATRTYNLLRDVQRLTPHPDYAPSAECVAGYQRDHDAALAHLAACEANHARLTAR